jgi:hypothetical protein
MGIIDLWLPILASAVVVFFASAAVWMALKWHDSDWHRTADEEAVRGALRGSSPGVYLVPYVMDPGRLKDPEVSKKYVEGPQAYITVVPNGLPAMGGKLLGSFVFYLFVSVLCAYILTRTIGADAPYLEVFRITGTVAWIAYGMAYIQDSIWFGKPWSITVKNLLDALIYGSLTAGMFGWLA